MQLVYQTRCLSEDMVKTVRRAQQQQQAEQRVHKQGWLACVEGVAYCQSCIHLDESNAASCFDPHKGVERFSLSPQDKTLAQSVLSTKGTACSP